MKTQLFDAFSLKFLELSHIFTISEKPFDEIWCLFLRAFYLKVKMLFLIAFSWSPTSCFPWAWWCFFSEIPDAFSLKFQMPLLWNSKCLFSETSELVDASSQIFQVPFLRNFRACWCFFCEISVLMPCLWYSRCFYSEISELVDAYPQNIRAVDAFFWNIRACWCLFFEIFRSPFLRAFLQSFFLFLRAC